MKMYLVLVFYLFTSILVNHSDSLKIDYYTSDQCSTIGFYCDLKTEFYDQKEPLLQIKNDLIRKNVKYLEFVKYEEEDVQITQIENLPNLVAIKLNNTGQLKMINFKNVPKLDNILVIQNNIQIINLSMFRHTIASKIQLFNNKIKLIENNSFGNHVDYVDLNCNQLDEFDPEWFSNKSALEVLHLTGNYIQNLKENSFKNFINLHRIYLSLNGLKTIHINTFPSRNYFEVLFLSFNELKEIKSNIFKNDQIEINLLDLRYNDISFFSKLLMDKLSFGKTPLIDGNPFQCPCYLNQITKWINWTTYGETDKLLKQKDIPDEPRCVTFSEEYRIFCVEAVSQDLIDYYKKNRTPTKINRNNFCSCFNKNSYIPKRNFICLNEDNY